MPQILIAIIIIIIRLAMEAEKSNKKSNTKYDKDFKRTTMTNNGPDASTVYGAIQSAATAKSDIQGSSVYSSIEQGYKDMGEDVPDYVSDLAVVEDRPKYKQKSNFMMPPTRSVVEKPLTVEDEVPLPKSVDNGYEGFEEKDPFAEYSDIGKTESSPIISRLKFMVTTLVYVMYEDDGEFSKKEKKLVDMVIKVACSQVGEKDKEELRKISSLRPNLDYLFDKVEEYGLSSDEVFDIVKELRGTVKGKKQYESIFKRIENRMTYEI